MRNRTFHEVDELDEDNVTIVPFASEIGGQITATLYGPFVPDKDVFESDPMPIEDSYRSGGAPRKGTSCEVVVKDPQKLWDPARGNLI